MNAESIKKHMDPILDSVINNGIIENAFFIRQCMDIYIHKNESIKPHQEIIELRTITDSSGERFEPFFIIKIQQQLTKHQSKPCYDVLKDLNHKGVYNIMIYIKSWDINDKKAKQAELEVFNAQLYANDNSKIYQNSVCPLVTKENLIVRRYNPGEWVDILNKKGDIAYAYLQEIFFSRIDNKINKMFLDKVLLDMRDNKEYDIEYEDLY